MHLTPSRRRGLRATIASLVGITALLAATVAPVAAQLPGPPFVPALSGLVTDSCTGLPIASGLSVAVAFIAPVGSPPGLPFKPPTRNFGFFSYRTLDPGTYQLTIDAPGYTSLGADPTSPVGGSPGVTIMKPPTPNLPAGQAIAIGLLLDVRLVPTRLPTSCIPPGPPDFPALAGRVTDSTTGRGVQGLTVGVAMIDPTTGALGIPQKPPSPNFGFFSYRSLDPGSYQLTIDAPGYTSLGVVRVVGGAPGVTLIKPPSPNLPAGQIVNESLVVAVQLPPGSPPANDFAISASPASLTVAPGASGNTTIVTSLTSGSVQSISLSVTGLPSGVTASFSPAAVSFGQSSTLSLSVAASASAGTSTLTISGSATSGSHNTSLSFTVTDPAAGAPSGSG